MNTQFTYDAIANRVYVYANNDATPDVIPHETIEHVIVDNDDHDAMINDEIWDDALSLTIDVFYALRERRFEQLLNDDCDDAPSIATDVTHEITMPVLRAIAKRFALR